jgi:uncharacterized surface protein with fasciclin (FAS1) repeats
MTRSRFTRFAAVAAVAGLTLTACGDDGDEAAEETTPTEAPSSDDAGADEPGTIVDVAVANGSFTTLVAAVQAAGLVDTLSSDGPFTVFAPTDDAFAAALDALDLTAEELLADTETLTSILTYHVVAGEVDAATAISLDGQTAATLNGADIAISVVDGNVMVDDATVVIADVPASNGIIHAIDQVLLPPADEMSDEMSDDVSEDAAALGSIVDVAVEAGSFTRSSPPLRLQASTDRCRPADGLPCSPRPTRRSPLPSKRSASPSRNCSPTPRRSQLSCRGRS